MLETPSDPKAVCDACLLESGLGWTARFLTPVVEVLAARYSLDSC
jgi:hypothetical protein